MFKKYDDASHWGLFIPVGFKRRRFNVWECSSDGILSNVDMRIHLCFTLKITRVPAMRFSEYRLRIGMQYL